MTGGGSTEPHLFVYLDQGTSLDIFARAGILERELAVYRRLAAQGHRLTILSWGRAEDAAYRDRLGPIDLVHNTTRRRNRIWMLQTLAALRRRAEAPPVVLTNQLPGAASAMVIARAIGAPSVLRFGYLRSSNVRMEHGGWSPHTIAAGVTERIATAFATRIVTTTSRIRDQVMERYGIAQEKIAMLENYVDTTLFSTRAPDPEAPPRALTLVTTCRLSPEKNVNVLLRAAALLENVAVVVVGRGPEEDRLRTLAADLGVAVEFTGVVENPALPGIYARCDAFALVSSYEGHPKSLIEAMACGLPVIGARVRGIVDVLDDGQTGLLTEIDPRAVAAAIEKLRDPRERRALGDRARAAARVRFDLDTYAVKLWEIVMEAFRAGR